MKNLSGVIILGAILTIFWGIPKVGYLLLSEEEKAAYDLHRLLFRTLKAHPERLNERSGVYLLSPLPEEGMIEGVCEGIIYSHNGILYKKIPLTRKVLDTLSGKNLTLCFEGEDEVYKKIKINIRRQYPTDIITAPCELIVPPWPVVLTLIRVSEKKPKAVFAFDVGYPYYKSGEVVPGDSARFTRSRIKVMKKLLLK